MRSMRKNGAQCHLSASQREEIFQTWDASDQARGVIGTIAKKFGVSHVTVSNTVLRFTGRRPIYHQADAKTINRESE